MRCKIRRSKMCCKIFCSSVNIVVTPVLIKIPVQNMRPGTVIQNPTYPKYDTCIPNYMVLHPRRLEFFSSIIRNFFCKSFAYMFSSTGNLRLAAKNK